MGSTLINLPGRSNEFRYTPEQVQDVCNGLAEAAKGQGVVVDAEQDTEGKAISRAQKMQEALKRLSPPVKVKAHAVMTTEPERYEKKKVKRGDKTTTVESPVGGGWTPAVSLPSGAKVPTAHIRATEATEQPSTTEGQEQPPAENQDTTNQDQG